MLTPAEELGLSGMNLALRVRKAINRLPEEELAGMLLRVREESARRHLVYMREGREDVINVLACPITMLPDQHSYIHAVCLTMDRALKSLAVLYWTDLEVQRILKLPPGEEEWLSGCRGKSHEESDPVFGRLDAVVDPRSPTWKESLRFLEPNMSGIGGLHLVPTCEGIIRDVVFPIIREMEPDLQLETGRDIRDLLVEAMLDHLKALGRPARTLCFVEPLSDATGTVEQEDLARYIHDRFGMKALHADPSSLSIEKGEVVFRGDSIDLAYRDYSVADLLALAKKGVDVEPMRRLFAENRMVSSITAEIDQKSCWEVLTDPAIIASHFDSDERQLFRRHVPWTRLVGDRKTVLPDGRTGDLLEHLRKEHDRFVLKPNRSYGGDGVVIGHALSLAEWDAAIEEALAGPDLWVVQRLAGIPVHEFPVLGPDGRVHSEPFHTVMGFASTRDGLATMGRASQKQVVNIAQRGGMCAVVTGHPPGALVGPSGRRA